MSQPVTFENDVLRLDVWPMTGGKISSILDKADRFELLFNYPDEFPTVAQYDMPYSNGWYAGWDECFPAIGPGPYPGHPYDGIAVPDHGELWGLPTVAVPTKNGITTVWHGLRFGYRLARKLSIDGSSLVAEYTLVNLAPFDLHFVWAAHALMSMAAPVEIDAGGGTGFRFSHDADDREHGGSFAWPHAAAGEDLSRPAELPAKRGWKVFSAEPIARPAVVRYPTRGRQVTIAYEGDAGEGDAAAAAAAAASPHAYWGIWINTGGWAGHHHFAIEPTTGRYDQLHRAVRDGTAGRLPALGRLGWTVRWTLGPLA